MQFHLDGFQVGDPLIKPCAATQPPNLPDEVDVLIAGSGPVQDVEKRPGGDDIFDLRGIDRDEGALVVVRPDQYVGHVLPLDAYDEIADYLAPLLVPRQ